MNNQIRRFMLYCVIVFSTALSGVGAIPSPALGKSQPPPPHRGKPDTIVLRLDPASGTAISTINNDYGTTTQEAIKGIPGAYVVKTRDGRDAHGVADKMSKDGRFLFAEDDMLAETVDANPARIGAWGMPVQPLYLNQDAVGLLGLPQAHAIARGAGTLVAVLDTGVQSDHPGLAGSLVQGYDFVDDDSTPEDIADGRDDNGDGRVDEVYGHGTHIAGIVHLVAPDAKIMPLRVIDADGRGSIISVAEAIAFAIQNGATVINISLGTAIDSVLMRSMVDDATGHGILVVASAGNLDSDIPQYPAADDCAIGVTSTSAADARSPFSSFGKWVDFSAPGEMIYSTFPVNSFAHWSGTSMAAPFVSGQIALIRSAAPQLSIRDVVKVIQNSAVSIDKLKTNKHEKGRLGIGRIDIGTSVQMALSGHIDQSGPKKIKRGCLN